MENYPFFKFHPGEWREGDISFLSLQTQGLFLNICCFFWMFSGKVTWKEVSKRLPTAEQSDYDRLISEGILNESDGFIHISFLNRQMEKCKEKSATNSQNGKDGAKKKNELLAIAKQTLTNSKPIAKQTKSNSLANGKQKEREDKIRKIDSNTTVGSGVTSSESSNGTPLPLRGQGSSKQLQTGEEYWMYLQDIEDFKSPIETRTEGAAIFDKILIHPQKAEIFEELKNRREQPDVFWNEYSAVHNVKVAAWTIDKEIFPELTNPENTEKPYSINQLKKLKQP